MIGGPVVRQHVVEFISGSTTGGIWTDGVRDTSQGTSGPYTWTVPAGVAQMTLDACGGGQAGGAGAYQASALSAGGGSGGGSGSVVRNIIASVTPKASLTITLAAGGVGTAASDGASNLGGATSIAGLKPGVGVVSGTMTLAVQSHWIGNSPTSSTSAVDTNGQGNGTAGGAGVTGSTNLSFGFAGHEYGVGACSGGGGKAGGVAGASGGFAVYGYSNHVTIFGLNSFSSTSAGTTSGGGSWGGGGRGYPSYFSNVSPAGGNGDAVGTDAGEADFGAGGGGGGGSGTARRRGGNGGNGYVRFTYWSAD